MIRTLTEPKAQRWRAVVRFKDGTTGLVCLGASINQVRDNYGEAFTDLYMGGAETRTPEDVDRIVVEKWYGQPDRGQWRLHQVVPVPGLAEAETDDQLIEASPEDNLDDSDFLEEEEPVAVSEEE